jgi:tetratricopeptide (TPR) repeat protein
MATTPTDKGGAPPPHEMPQSKPLQIFLLVALVISGASYVADEWNQVFAPRRATPDRLHRLVEARSEYASHMEAGLRMLRLNQLDAALEQFRLASQAQNTAESHYNTAATLLKLSRPDDAITEFTNAVHINPHYAEVYFAWGNALMAQGKPDQALSVFRDAIQGSPNSGLAQFDVALALMAQQKEAQAALRAAQSEDRTNDVATLTAQTDRLRAEALQHIMQAHRLGLERPDLSFACGQLLSQELKFAEAESWLLSAVSNKPDVADAHFALGVAQSHLGKDADAISQFNATLVLRHDDPPTLDRLAFLYATTTNADLRSPKMAIQLATRANEAATSQNPRFMDTLARCYAADGDFLQALNWEGQAINRATQIHDTALLKELQARNALFVDHKTE